MKKTLAIVLVLIMALSLAACGGSSKEEAVAGVCWYNFGDTFIANARSTLNAAAENGPVKVVDADSLNDVATQTSNINNFYTQGVKYLVVNNINNNAISEMIEQAKEKGVTLIFANSNSPTDEEFALYENVYHVSSVATQSGTIMGEALVKYWNEHPEADRNGNGKLDYIMLLGIQGHYDTEVRASYSVQALTDAGIATNCIMETICNYQRSDAQNQVASILQANMDDVEAVIACNDDMALGAIEALKAAGFFTGDDNYIPVVGVDATANGVEALKEGTMLCTALNNPVILGNSVYKLITLLEEGKELTQENVGIEGTTVEGHHIYINYVGITAENTEDAAY
ncbi:MAG: substrate-binding domain-containing protein [Faecousia sp.]